MIARAMLAALLLASSSVAAKPSNANYSAYAQARQYPPHSEKVCLLNQSLSATVMAEPVGRMAARYRGEPGVSLDTLFADKARMHGANLIVVVNRDGEKGQAGAFYVAPDVELDCAAAGGQLR